MVRRAKPELVHQKQKNCLDRFAVIETTLTWVTIIKISSWLLLSRANMGRALKISISLAVVLATAACALWIVGGKRMRYSTSLLIDAPPAEVFTHLTDADLMKKWMDGLVTIEPVDVPLNQIGAKAKVVFESGGKQIEYNDEIIRYEEAKLLSVKAKNRLVTLTSIYRLEPKEEGGKTYLTYVVKSTHQGIGKLLAPFIRSPIEDKIVSDAQRLKTLVESSTGHPSSLNATPGDPLGNAETLTSGATGKN